MMTVERASASSASTASSSGATPNRPDRSTPPIIAPRRPIRDHANVARRGACSRVGQSMGPTGAGAVVSNASTRCSTDIEPR